MAVKAYSVIMELTYNELKKRDVINVTDGRCLGRIIDARFSFPDGVIIGIIVPGRRTKGLLRIFDKSELYIDESRIIKIGGDVILVDVNCGDTCSTSVKVNRIEKRPEKRPKPCPPPCKPCPPPPCKKPCAPEYPRSKSNDGQVDFSLLSGGDGGYDGDEY